MPMAIRMLSALCTRKIPLRNDPRSGDTKIASCDVELPTCQPRSPSDRDTLPGQRKSRVRSWAGSELDWTYALLRAWHPPPADCPLLHTRGSHGLAWPGGLPPLAHLP